MSSLDLTMIAVLAANAVLVTVNLPVPARNVIARLVTVNLAVSGCVAAFVVKKRRVLSCTSWIRTEK